MAALDVLQRVNSGWGAFDWTATFAAANPGDLLLLCHLNDNGAATLTKPGGMTDLYDSGAGGYPRVVIAARVYQPGDPLSYNYATSSPAGTGGVFGRRIEGPFTDLSTVTVTRQAAVGSAGAESILTATSSVAAGTLVLALIAMYGRDQQTSFGGGFGNVQRIVQAGQLPSMGLAEQFFASASTSVQTNVTWATGGDPVVSASEKFLITITAPVAGPSARKRRGVVGQEVGRRSKSHVANHRRATRNMLSAILSGSSITPSTLPPDYYAPRKPRVTFPPVLSPIVSFDP